MALTLTKVQFDQNKAFEEAAGAGLPWATLFQWLLVGIKYIPSVLQIVLAVTAFIKGGGSVADAIAWGEAAVMALVGGQQQPPGPPLLAGANAPATKMTP